MSEGFFVGHGGWPVFHRWVVPQVVRARVLVVHGYSEHSGRYLHVLDALRQAGFAAVAADHRGHGRTARVRGDLEDRERVLTDLGVAHRRLLELGSGPVFLLAHSFGGAIGLRYLERHGDAFRGAVLNGVGLKVPSSIPTAVRVAAKLVARVAPTLPMQPFFDAKRNTRDPEAQQELIDDPIGYRGRIRARTGVEVMALIEEVRRDLDRVRVPLLLTHGSADLHVPAAVSEEVLRAVGSTDKTLVEWPGLLHETWREPEKDRVIAGWVDWIAARLG